MTESGYKKEIEEALSLEGLRDEPSIIQKLVNGFTDREEKTALKQNLWRYFCGFELKDDNYDKTIYDFGKARLTEEEITELKNSIREEDRKLVSDCFLEYNTFNAFSLKLEAAKDNYLNAFSQLAILLCKWDHYEQTAHLHTIAYKDFEKTDPEGAEWYRHYIMNYNGEGAKWDGAKLVFDEKEKAFKVAMGKEVEREGRDVCLYSQIMASAELASIRLSSFKAFVVAVLVALEKSILHYTPWTIVVNIADAMGETYSKGLVENRKYFRREINKKRLLGETVTPEEERYAVIPDFYEVGISKNVYKACLDGIKGIREGRII